MKVIKSILLTLLVLALMGWGLIGGLIAALF